VRRSEEEFKAGAEMTGVGVVLRGQVGCVGRYFRRVVICVQREGTGVIRSGLWLIIGFDAHHWVVVLDVLVNEVFNVRNVLVCGVSSDVGCEPFFGFGCVGVRDRDVVRLVDVIVNLFLVGHAEEDILVGLEIFVEAVLGWFNRLFCADGLEDVVVVDNPDVREVEVAGIVIGLYGNAVAVTDARDSCVGLAVCKGWANAVDAHPVEGLPLGFVEGHRIAEADRELVAPDFDAASVVCEGDAWQEAQWSRRWRERHS